MSTQRFLVLRVVGVATLFFAVSSARLVAANNDDVALRAQAMAVATVHDPNHPDADPTADPRYYAALRYFLAKGADEMVLPHGVDGARALRMPSAVPSTMPMLKLDSDPDYRNWLVEQPAASVLSDQGFGIQGVRSIGSNFIHPGDGNSQFDSVILLRGPRTKFCSAVLLSSVLALTAGHCLCPYSPDYAEMGDDPYLAPPPQPKIRTSFQAVALDCLNLDGTMPGNDYALVLLDTPVSPTPAKIDPAGVVEKLTAGGTIWVAGYGATSAAGVDSPSQKNFIKALIVSPFCGRAGPQADSSLYKCSTGNELVSTHILNDSGQTTFGGPCHGDSGGAVFARPSEAVEGAVDKRFYLVAIVSRVVDPHGACGDATVYTLLTSQLVAALRTAASRDLHTQLQP